MQGYAVLTAYPCTVVYLWLTNTTRMAHLEDDNCWLCNASCEPNWPCTFNTRQRRTLCVFLKLQRRSPTEQPARVIILTHAYKYEKVKPIIVRFFQGNREALMVLTGSKHRVRFSPSFFNNWSGFNYAVPLPCLHWCSHEQYLAGNKRQTSCLTDHIRP